MAKKSKKQIEYGKIFITTEPSPPEKPEKQTPLKKEDDTEHSDPKPGITDPQRTDPTRIEEPKKNDQVLTE